MKHNTGKLLAFLCLGWLVACNSQLHNRNGQLTGMAQQLLEQYPDSALMLLDSVNTVSFSDAEKAGYTLLRVQAKDQAGQDISTDTEIFQAREYFIGGNDREKAALACFYSAKVATANNDTVLAAMAYYQEALDHVRQTDNKLLRGKILYNMGFLDFNRGWYPDAVVYYKQALSVFRSMEGQYGREIFALNAIGNSFLADNKRDSAMFYYNRAMNKARSQSDTVMLATVLNNIGLGCMSQKMFNEACRYFYQTTRLPTGHQFFRTGQILR